MKYIGIAFKSFLRLVANHCIVPSLRTVLLRWSGIGIGRNAFVNMGVKFVDDWKKGMIELGDQVSIATNVVLVATSNPNNSFLSREFDVVREAPIKIERGSWIGAGAVILPGVVIGEGAIVGANAVVTRDVQSYTVVGGVPAKLIRHLQNG